MGLWLLILVLAALLALLVMVVAVAWRRRGQRLGELQAELKAAVARAGELHDEREAARASADAAARAKGDFLANMSHEIRTPLNAVLGLTHIVLRTSLSARQRDYLEKIEGSSRSLLRVVNDILDFSKIDAGMLQLDSATFELDPLLDDVAIALDAQVGSRPLELVVYRDDEVPGRLHGDGPRLKQVLLNLASNAVKFTPNGEVCVSVTLESAEPLMLRFAVADTGIGMTDTDREHLFESFSQADTSLRRNQGGTGLGLSISQRLVRMMGGDIAVKSEPRKGSEFSFVLPMQLAGGAHASPARRAASARHLLRGLNAMVVDDNHTACSTLTAMLRSFGMNVTPLAGGRAAIEAARQAEAGGRRFDVALVDWRMPDVDGFALIDTLRGIGSMARSAFVMVSAYDKQHVQNATPAQPPDGVLQKPVTASTLLDTLHEVLGRHRRQGDRRPMADVRMPDWPQLHGDVLLVEDNEINQLVGVELLQTLGLKVRVADSAAQALEQLAQRRFDAILMDVQMPGTDGLEATRLVRAMPENAQLPIIAMTANALNGERERCLAAGMTDYLAKPVEPEQLAQCLQLWLPQRPALPVRFGRVNPPGPLPRRPGASPY